MSSFRLSGFILGVYLISEMITAHVLQGKHQFLPKSFLKKQSTLDQNDANSYLTKREVFSFNP